MYNQFFGLRENPFNVNPDPRYLFLTRQTREAWDGLTRGIQARKGLLLLTGEVGTGKTTLLNHLLDWLHQQRSPTAFIFNSHLEISHLFDFMLADFAVKFDATLKDNALMRLHQWLWERYRAGDTPVVIVDEAQGLSNRVLEEIRMLLNLETANEKLLQIVLAGQPELEQHLQQPELCQVKQRIALRCKTDALSLEEAHDYMLARLHIAGADGPRIFASDAMDAVHFYSRGIPRVMNLLCEHALINASEERIQPVPARFVADVASEFQFDDSRPFAPSSSFASVPCLTAIPAQSRFLHALVALSASNERESPAREYPGPSVISTARPHGAPDNVLSPVPGTGTPFLHHEDFQDDAADAPPSAQPSEPGPSSRSEHAIAPLSDQALESTSKPEFAASPEQNFAARSEQSLALISEQHFTWPSDASHVHLSSHSAPPRQLSLASRSEQNSASTGPPDVEPAASAAPWNRQLEARLLADWTSFFSEIGSSLASHPAGEPATEHAVPTNPPRLHLVESKSALGVSSVASRRHAPGFQHLTPPRSGARAAKSLAVSSALMKLIPLRLILVGWSTKSRARFSSAVTASANSSTMGNVTQLSARCLRPLRTLYWGSLASAGRCLDFAASIDWAQMEINASRWLRQPCDPTQWRLLDSRLLEDMFRFNHRKM
jgi:type II secretory pathway predicted ATPase ExeA